MRPGEYDYEVEGGDCLPLIVVLKDGNEAAIPLTGYRSTFELVYPGDSLILSTEGGRLEMGEADSPAITGEIAGELTAAETSVLPYGRIAKYEWSVLEPNGCKKTFLKGYIIRS